VISRSPPEPTQPARQRGIVDIVRRHGTYLSQQWGWLAELRRRLGRGDANSLEEKLDPELEFGLGGPEFGPNATISFLLKRVTDPAAQERRAANYNFLLERLRSFVPKQFAHPPEGASPFAFPIRHDRGEELIDRLARHSVFARRLWAHPHPCLPQADFAGAAALRKSVIIGPCTRGYAFETSNGSSLSCTAA
jgi:hypothetical protein